jgi:hypothetical protein
MNHGISLKFQRAKNALDLQTLKNNRLLFLKNRKKFSHINFSKSNPLQSAAKGIYLITDCT